MIATILQTLISCSQQIAYFLLVLLIGIGIGIALDKTIIRRRNRRSIGRTSVLFKP